MPQQSLQEAESLWLQAHDSIRRGDLPRAARELAASFELLKTLRDPRLRQVHEKWVSVYRIIQEDRKSVIRRPQEASVQFKTLQAKAEAAANTGDLETAIATYQQIIQVESENELAKERCVELQAAMKKALEYQQGVASHGGEDNEKNLDSLSQKESPGAPLVPEAKSTDVKTADPEENRRTSGASLSDHQIAFLEGLLEQIQMRRKEMR